MSVIAHHGILGQKWGVRRYQNYDGTLTAYGRKRLDKSKKSINMIMKLVNILIIEHMQIRKRIWKALV